MNQLWEVLKKEAAGIISEFESASNQGQGAPQEIADFRENAVQSFLSRFYPANHFVSKGKITDLSGNQSNSIDCLILNPAHPHLIDSKGKFRLIFSDGCDAAIEVKPDIARSDELFRGLEQGISVKKIKRSGTSILLLGKSPRHIIEHSHYIPFFIFSIKAFEPRKLYEKIVQYYTENQTPIEHQIDSICILGKGILRNIKYKELNYFGQNSGWYFENWDELTLVGFLMNIGNTYPSVPYVAEPIMTRILKQIPIPHIERCGDSSTAL
ncbi:MAG: DUF6602 domain-containing protein [Thiotrichaceae bacterium]